MCLLRSKNQPVSKVNGVTYFYELKHEMIFAVLVGSLVIAIRKVVDVLGAWLKCMKTAFFISTMRADSKRLLFLVKVSFLVIFSLVIYL